MLNDPASKKSPKGLIVYQTKEIFKAVKSQEGLRNNIKGVADQSVYSVTAVQASMRR